MKIVVCIKQVPLVDQLRFDTAAGRLIRDGVSSEINPFDKRALTEAITLKKQFGGETVVLTMGPPQAETALRESLAMGIDRAVHLLGREFAGADTLATAYTLAAAIRHIGFDLVLCGKYATDAETGQVPGMLAEMLDIPQVTGVTRLELRPECRFTATRETDDGFETFEGSFPALLSTSERLIKPIKITPKEFIAAADLPVEVMTAADLGLDHSHVGLAGSPTWVEAIYSIEPERKHIVRTAGDNPESPVLSTVEDLVSEGLGGDWKSRERSPIRPQPVRDLPARSLWTVAEVIEGAVRPVTLELLGRGIQLAQKLNGELAAVLIGDGVEQLATVLAENGADKIYLADSPELAYFDTEKYASVLTRAIQTHAPYAVFIPATANGRDLAPRVAARLQLGLTGDCIGLRIDEQGRLVQLKPAFGGNIIAPILTRTTPAMATVRPGMLHPPMPEAGRQAPIIRLPVDNLVSRLKFISSEVNTEEGVSLDEAEVIIGVGMGIGGPENLPLIHDLARLLHAHVGATRRVVDAGWLPRQQQIGLTGHSVSPALYIAIGISGGFNHAVGIQRAGLILAINKNPEADIFKHCDYGLVGEWEPIVRSMIAVLTLAVPR